MTWEEHFDGLDATAHEFALLKLLVLDPGHETVSGELFLLATKEVKTVLANVVLVPLPEVKNKVVHLRVVGAIDV